MKQRAIRIAVVLFLSAGLFFLLLPAKSRILSFQTQNQCFACHTNARMLIKITREIAAENKDQPSATIASEGEG